jgi:hypothetical protein
MASRKRGYCRQTAQPDRPGPIAIDFSGHWNLSPLIWSIQLDFAGNSRNTTRNELPQIAGFTENTACVGFRGSAEDYLRKFREPVFLDIFTI